MDELYDRTFNHLIDRYLTTGTMDSEGYTNLSPRQKEVVQVIKRAFARLNKPEV